MQTKIKISNIHDVKWLDHLHAKPDYRQAYLN